MKFSALTIHFFRPSDRLRAGLVVALLLSVVLFTGLDMMLPLIHTEQEAEVKQDEAR